MVCQSLGWKLCSKVKVPYSWVFHRSPSQIWVDDVSNFCPGGIWIRSLGGYLPLMPGKYGNSTSLHNEGASVRVSSSYRKAPRPWAAQGYGSDQHVSLRKDHQILWFADSQFSPNLVQVPVFSWENCPESTSVETADSLVTVIVSWSFKLESLLAKSQQSHFLGGISRKNFEVNTAYTSVSELYLVYSTVVSFVSKTMENPLQKKKRLVQLDSFNLAVSHPIKDRCVLFARLHFSLVCGIPTHHFSCFIPQKHGGIPSRKIMENPNIRSK